MTVQVIVQGTSGEEIIRFPGEDYKTFHQMASEAGLELPISCGMGVCGFCLSKIIKGREYIDFGKKSMPLRDFAEDEVFVCVAGIKTSALTDKEEHEIILQAKI